MDLNLEYVLFSKTEAQMAVVIGIISAVVGRMLDSSCCKRLVVPDRVYLEVADHRLLINR